VGRSPRTRGPPEGVPAPPFGALSLSLYSDSTEGGRRRLRGIFDFFGGLLVFQVYLGGGYLKRIEARSVLPVGQKLCNLLDPTSERVFGVHVDSTRATPQTLSLLVLAREQKRRDRAICLGDDPEVPLVLDVVAGQKAAVASNGFVVGRYVLGIETLTPIALCVPLEALRTRRLIERGLCPGGHNEAS
jgi:hypothetical protein